MRKENMPSEHLRKLVYDLKNSEKHKDFYLGAIKYLPRAIYYFFANIPNDPDDRKNSPVIYHTSGILTSFLKGKKVYAEGFKNQIMHKYKETRGGEIHFPLFGDEEPLMDYQTLIGNIGNLMCIDEDKENVIDRGKENNCDRDNECISTNQDKCNDISPYLDDFFLNNARSLGLTITGGPTFYKPAIPPNPCIKTQRPENRVEYPFLYNKKTKIIIQPLRGDLMKEIKEKRVKYQHEVNFIEELSMPVNSSLDVDDQVVLSSFKNLKKYRIKNIKKMGHKKHKVRKIYSELMTSKYFQRTSISWLEAGMHLVIQGHVLLNHILKKKKISFFRVDSNFNLQQLRMITTKERKRSRVGHSFHLLREFLKITKYTVDVYILYRQGKISKENVDLYLHTLFTNIGKYTGIYRYKYKSMRQIKICKDIENIIKLPIPWPYWRVWTAYFKSHIPLLETYLENLIYRMIHGRETGAPIVTKQRAESHHDIYMKEKFAESILAITPEGVLPHVSELLKYYSEAWRYWKADALWNPDLKADYKEIIQRFIEEKARRYKERVVAIRQFIISQKTDNVVIRKNVGQLTRLYIKKESSRQRRYLSEDLDSEDEKPGKRIKENKESEFMQIDTAIEIYNWMYELFKRVEIVSFPDTDYVNDHKFLLLALNRVKSENSNNDSEQKILQAFTENPESAIKEIKKRLLSQRTFNEIQIALKDNIQQLYPTYSIDILERLTDAYLDQYICYELHKQGFFKTDCGYRDENLFITEILDSLKNFNPESRDLFITAKVSSVMERIDLNLLAKLLALILDPIIVSYIISRLNCKLCYKDMQFTNYLGCIKGFEFSGFISEFYFRIVDFYLRPHFKFYFRMHNELLLLPRSDQLNFQIDEEYILSNDNLDKLNGEMTYKRRYFDYIGTNKRISTKLEREICLELNNLLPKSIGTFYLEDIKVRRGEFDLCKINFKFRTSIFPCLTINSVGIQNFINNARSILKSSTRNTFLKIIQKWNRLLLSTAVYYREAMSSEFIEIITFYERKVQDIIKLGLNTKMPSRFPSVMFYAPIEIGGLGMLSIGIEDNMEFFSKKNTKTVDNLNTHHRISINHDLNEKLNIINKPGFIPSILGYIKSWKEEIEDSRLAYEKYASKKIITRDAGLPRLSTLIFLNNSIYYYDHGYRIRNLYKKFTAKNDYFEFLSIRHDGKLWNIDNYRKDILIYFGGMESILEHTLFSATNYLAFDSLFWENQVKENLEGRRLTTAQKAGINQIPNKRFAFWWSPTINRKKVYVGYQVQLDSTKIYMHGKLATIKGNYINIFRNQLWQKIHDSIVKDIFTQLKDYNVHKEIVYPKKSIRNMGSADLTIDELQNIQIQEICGCNDCTKINRNINNQLKLNNKSSPEKTFQEAKNEIFEKSIKGISKKSKNDDNELNKIDSLNGIIKNNYENSNELKSIWIDVQLRWGDYDSNNIRDYAKDLYYEYSGNKSFYSSKYGIIVAFDLCYNVYHAYGYLNSRLRKNLSLILANVQKKNKMLGILRERIRKGLQLYEQRIEHISEISELFNYHIIDDTLKNILIFCPKTGNLVKCPRDQLVETLEKLNIEKVIAKKSCPLDDTSIITMDYDFPLYKISSYVKMQTVCLYEGWKDTLSSYTCFCRLLLIVKALKVNKKIGTKIFDNNKIGTKIFDNKKLEENLLKPESRKTEKLDKKDSEPKRSLSFNETVIIFPKKTDDEWIELEKEMEMIIINDFCQKNGISMSDIPEYEIKNIIFGLPPKLKEGEERKCLKTAEQGILTGDKLKTTKNMGCVIKKETEGDIRSFSIVNKIGEEIEAHIERKFEFLETKENWKYVMKQYICRDKDHSDLYQNSIIKIQKIDLIAKRDKLMRNSFLEKKRFINHDNRNERQIRFPKCLIKKFISTSDLNTPLLGFILKRETCVIAIPPQMFVEDFYLPSKLPLNDKIEGIIIYKGNFDMFSKVCNRYSLNAYFINITDQIECYHDLTFNEEILVLTDDYGYFLVPEIWNYNFMRKLFDMEMVYTFKPGIPKQFFDGIHRNEYFIEDQF